MVQLIAILLVVLTVTIGFLFVRFRAARPDRKFAGAGWALAHHVVTAAFVILVAVEFSLPQEVFGVPEGGVDFRSGLIISGAIVTVLLLPLTALAGAATVVQNTAARWVILGIVWVSTISLITLHLQPLLR